MTLRPCCEGGSRDTGRVKLRCKGEEKKHIIERLWEKNMLESVLKTLSSQEIFEVRRVCRKWRDFLSKAVIRSLSLPTPHVSAGAFMLNCNHTAITRVVMEREDGSEYYVAAADAEETSRYNGLNWPVMVDTEGRCHCFRDMFGEKMKGVTSNGLIFFKRPKDRLTVDNPWARRSKLLSYTSLSGLVFFSGAGFDPCTRVFKYVEGGWCKEEKMIMLVLDSSLDDHCRKFEFSHTEYLPTGVSVSSWGCLFWLENERESLVVLELQDMRFRVMHLPKPPENNERFTEWKLHGGEGNVVAVCLAHNNSGRPNRAYGWKLKWHGEGRGCDYEWVPLHFDLGRAIVDTQLCTSCVYQQFTMVIDCKMSTCGCWLVIHNCDSDKGCSKLFILDVDGKLKHTLSRSMLISHLPPILDRGRINVTEAWPFQVNNMCWPRA